MRNIIVSSFMEKLQAFYSRKVKKQYRQRMLRYEEEVFNSEAFRNGISDTKRMVTAGNNFVLQFGICRHPVHPSCVKEKVLTCPIDRSRRNGFLPALDGIGKQKIFKDYEACHEVHEDTLTDNNNNYTEHMIEVFMGFVSSFVKALDFSTSSDPLRKEKEVILFLKRVCLADHFLLNNKNISSEREFSSILDWDEILSVSNLSEYYKVNFGRLSGSNRDEFEFRPFVDCLKIYSNLLRNHTTSKSTAW